MMKATVDMCESGDEDDPEWSGGSLKFTAGCEGDCEEVTATVCNDGSGDMNTSTAYEVYFSADGEAKSGAVVGTGTVDALGSGECTDLTFTPTDDGNYIFKAYQEDGHPGTGELWSGRLQYR